MEEWMEKANREAALLEWEERKKFLSLPEPVQNYINFCDSMGKLVFHPFIVPFWVTLLILHVFGI